jgi:glucose-6-phosphate isomerase
MDLLKDVVEETNVHAKVQQMFNGDKINTTEGRSVLHVALRKPAGESLNVGGTDVVANVHAVNSRIKAFTDKIRSGEISGHTGKKLQNIVAIGIGGSFLGPEFVFEALKYDSVC